MLPPCCQNKPCALHSGKWTYEEQEYTKELIVQFREGTLSIDEGLSLRRFLSKVLNCHPKRISKKFEGSPYNGKQLYKRKLGLTAEEKQLCQAKLSDLEHKYQESLKVLRMVEASRTLGGSSPNPWAATAAGDDHSEPRAVPARSPSPPPLKIPIADLLRAQQMAKARAALAFVKYSEGVPAQKAGQQQQHSDRLLLATMLRAPTSPPIQQNNVSNMLETLSYLRARRSVLERVGFNDGASSMMMVGGTPLSLLLPEQLQVLNKRELFDSPSQSPSKRLKLV